MNIRINFLTFFLCAIVSFPANSEGWHYLIESDKMLDQRKLRRATLWQEQNIHIRSAQIAYVPNASQGHRIQIVLEGRAILCSADELCVIQTRFNNQAASQLKYFVDSLDNSYDGRIVLLPLDEDYFISELTHSVRVLLRPDWKHGPRGTIVEFHAAEPLVVID